MPKPKGHKRGCKCVICSPATRKRTQRRVRRNHGYENQGAALVGGPMVRRNSTVPVGGKKTVRGRAAERELNLFHRKRNPDDWHWKVGELRLYLENTGELYPDLQRVRKNLLRKLREGRLTAGVGHTAFKPVVHAAARMYQREIDPKVTFPITARTAVAKELYTDFVAEAQAGEYDYLLPRSNPAHYPRTARGPKGNVKWYILDLRDGRGNLISSRYRRCARAKCATEAAGLVDRKVGKRMVRKVELSGPYSRKPGASTTRK